MFTKELIKDWMLLSPAGRVLVINGFTFNLGFYMLLPYLANHLEHDLGISGWYVGLIVGLRVLSQQGLFLVGGTLADRLGYKPLILLGCALRIIGFAVLGGGESVPALLLGSFLSGFAGALFTPSSQAYLALECREQKSRDKVFALQSLTSEAGMLVGPLFGLALIHWDFIWVGVLSAGLFAILLIIQWRYLPALEPQQAEQADTIIPFWQQWLSMFRNRAFMAFILCASVYQLLFHQLYLAIPHQVRVVTEDISIITWVFLTSSILGVLMQLPISRFVDDRLGTARGMGLGMSIMGAGYMWLTVSFAAFPALPFIFCAIFFSVGSMLVFPLLGAYIPTFCSPKTLASHYGLYASIGGLYAFLGNISTGWLLSLSTLAHVWIWIGLAMLGMLSGLLLFKQIADHKSIKKVYPSM